MHLFSSKRFVLVRIAALVCVLGTLVQATASSTAHAADSDSNIYLPMSIQLGQPAAISTLATDLTSWKLTLPIGSSGKPTEIKQPQLATYQLDPWFITTSGVMRFRAPVNGVTTSGSSFPRTELREMTNGGKTNAAWSSTSGTHIMTVDEAITAVPQTKKKLISAQIHDSSEDLMTIKFDSPTLFIDVQGKKVYTLDANYTLGKRFIVTMVASGGQVKVYYNNSANPVYTLTKNISGAYFKAGTFLQSNCSIEGSALCTSDNYGEVVIYNVTVTHN